MNEVGEILTDDDALLEELRWFVYPKESATWLTNCVNVPPETDSPHVLGALRPRTVNLIETELRVQEMELMPTPQRTTIINCPFETKEC
jgi:hypothetical protein